MATPTPTPGAASAPTPNLQLTPQERLAFAHLFSLADPANSGIVQGHTAVPFFAKSKLPSSTLGQIWSIADSSNNGFLTAPTFSVALRLIGHAQRGEQPDEALIQRPGPPPTMEGVQLPTPSAVLPMSPQRTGSGSVPAPPLIDAASRARFTRLFASAGPVGGLLEGDKAKDILVKSKLPFDKLGAIWSLADTKQRGALDLTDFIIAMHFIQQSMNGAIAVVPTTMPPGLYESAAGVAGPANIAAPGSPLRSQHTGNAIPRQLTGQSQPIQRQLTGQSQPLSPAHTGARSGFGSPLGPQRTGLATAPSFLHNAFATSSPPWIVTNEEKTAADTFFDALDTQKKGVLEGPAVVPFFMQSQLSEQALAHVWDLADITQTGSLNKDEFAVAMHLIKSSLAGNTLPDFLPTEVVPPSLRNQHLPEPVNPNQTDTQKDLFSLMDDDDDGSAALPPPVSAASAFGAPAPGAPVAPGTQVSAPPQTAPAQRSVSSPFDDDFFGGGATSGSAPAAPPASRQATQLPTDQSADYGNKSLQLNSTQKSVDELQSKRTALEAGVAQNATSLAELETRLATVKSTHETESRLVKELESRRDKQAAELKTLRDELISEESELSRLKAEKDEIEQQVLHDREEVRDSKKRMTVVQTELNALKSQLEKLRKEARQQKGLVAIGKKQLSTAEAEREKVQGEIESGNHGEVEESAQGTHMPGGIESVTSPAASVRSYNPFDRQQGGQAASSPALGTAALAAAGGAAAATAGVAALHHGGQEEEDDPFGATSTPTPAQPAADPWGGNAATTTGGGAAFDDAFGDDFAPSGGEQQQHQTQNTTANDAAFDDAFGNAFGEKGAEDAGTQDVPQAQENSIGSAPLPENPGNAEQLDDVPAATATPDVFESNVADAPVKDAEEVAAVPAPAPAATADEPQQDTTTTDTDDSDDEEGPEDVEAFRRRVTESPDEVGVGKAATAAGVGAAGLGAVGVGATALPSATTAAQASDRFPELPDEDIDASGSALAAPPADSSGVSSQGTGDAFEDAQQEQRSAPHEQVGELPAVTQQESQLPLATQQQESQVPPAVTQQESQLPPAVTQQESQVPPATQQEGAFTPAATPQVLPPAAPTTLASSPSLSTKTRRAPPPAPVRGSTGSAASTPAATAVSLPAVQPPQQASAFDDFEASFADLGSGGAASATPSTATATANTGFDDAFDDADFDFVPSFGGAGTAQGSNTAVPGGFPTQSQSQSQSQPPNAFASFDDAFADFGGSSGGATQAAPNPAAHTSSGGNTSESSAFSFEDAFAPPASVSLTDPGATSAAPSLPSRAGGAGLAPPTSEAPRSTSPALADDAGPVRQLAAMGFPRHKVIQALERSNYRVEKALEKLLADV